MDNRILADAERKFSRLPSSIQAQIKQRIEALKRLNASFMKPWEIGQLLHKEQEQWDASFYGGYNFTDFERLLMKQLGFQWSRANLLSFKAFWRIYSHVPSDQLSKVDARQAEALASNYKKRLDRRLTIPLESTDFYVDPYDALNQMLLGKITPNSFKSELKTRKVGKIENLQVNFRNEREIEQYIWEHNNELFYGHEIHLSARQVSLPETGKVDFTGWHGDGPYLIVVEAKDVAKAPDVGQVLAYANELKGMLRQDESVSLGCQEGAFFDEGIQKAAWIGVRGCIVAQRFDSSFFYGVKGQDIWVYRVLKSDCIFSAPFSAWDAEQTLWNQWLEQVFSSSHKEITE
jgi:hypothetical protein